MLENSASLEDYFATATLKNVQREFLFKYSFIFVNFLLNLITLLRVSFLDVNAAHGLEFPFEITSNYKFH
jgi:hypothetical protein